MCEPVKLVGAHGCPFSHRAEVALRLKVVPYELIMEDAAEQSGLLLTLNPVAGEVPVLLHGGRAISSSLVIVEYVDEAFAGAPILPADPYGRATARFWARFIDKELCSRAMWRALWAVGDAQRAAMEETKAKLRHLEGQLEGKSFFGGDGVGLVDIAACGVAHWLEAYEEATGVRLLTDDELPALRRWATECTSHEAVKEGLPDKEYLVDMFATMSRLMLPPE